ncbi:2-amino-3-carboxymuconate-6-semialdehyde decarboxylase [Aspergillus nomiae NRRL 13137]|uniref:6-methylsalicylate decarboxylase n=1 Tax=Aspergillus nomiae NRRL (strain ATCC 15546 / NRRL 13137 / CBS 260.88 / M93) TaxID=1509407 RepID=A0A0L1IUZ2_ASPN3|nr:2-amino-3-carboxymuconate-6-semialdehyde decarboxylase [Aspergillus nomiae NRRL 13137]KNG83317.1 2-amino-3-carboxymuconate-6-semialdehyde decarboxylase [Aspergillus nomiae NRRL 13137]
MARRIDVHHHYLPPAYLKALEEAGGDPSGFPTPSWSIEADQQLCDDCGIETAILSVTAPGAGIVKGAKSAQVARECNEFGKTLRDKYPKKYGFFAALPDVLDTQAALEEIRYALDELQADGVTLFTRYGDANYYLGHPDIQPIWEELDRRAAVVFIHPTHAVDTNLINKMLPQPFIDYPHETTRTAVDLITTDTDCRLSSMTREHFLENARMFYYDLALTDANFALPLLQKFASPDHILYGSDFPYAPTTSIKFFSKDLAEADISDEAAEKINYGNALNLFPRLR